MKLGYLLYLGSGFAGLLLGVLGTDGVKLWDELDAVHLDHDVVEVLGVLQGLDLVVHEDRLDNQVTEEHRPATLYVLEETQLPGLVVQPRRILKSVYLDLTFDACCA